MENATAVFHSVCAWSGCSKWPDMGQEMPLCFEHYYAVVNHWRKESAAASEERAEVKAKVERGEKLGPGERPPGWIYYLRVGDLMKIGHAEHLRGRIGAYPPNAQLLAAEPGTREMEKARHQWFRAYRAEGREWYRPNAELDTHIASVLEEHGDPARHLRSFLKRKAGAPQKRNRVRVL